MPYFRPATDAPFGAIPYDQVLRIGVYQKDASAAAIYPGDLVMLEADGKVAPATASNAELLGVAAAFSAGSTADNAVLVYDHPDQLFVMQDDSDTAPITAVDVGFNYDSITTTGDTATNRSRHEIDADSGGTTAALQLRVLGMHPMEFVDGAPNFTSTAGNPRKWIVRINEHILNKATGV